MEEENVFLPLFSHLRLTHMDWALWYDIHRIWIGKLSFYFFANKVVILLGYHHRYAVKQSENDWYIIEIEIFKGGPN